MAVRWFFIDQSHEFVFLLRFFLQPLQLVVFLLHLLSPGSQALYRFCLARLWEFFLGRRLLLFGRRLLIRFLSFLWLGYNLLGLHDLSGSLGKTLLFGLGGSSNGRGFLLLANLFGFSSLLLKPDTLSLGGSLSFFTLLLETGGLFFSFNALTFGFGHFGGDSLNFDASCLMYGFLLFLLFMEAFGLEACLFSLAIRLLILDS